jgi:hypothetical protein
MLLRVEMPRPPMVRKPLKEVMPRKKKEPQKRKSLLAMPPRVKRLRALLFLFLSRLLPLLLVMILREEMLPLLLMVRRLLPRKVRPRRRLPQKLLLHLPRPKL